MRIGYTELESKVRARLKESRFIHSRGVAETAAMLASRFGMSAEDARYAGIYHDAYRYCCTAETLSICRDAGICVFPEEERDPMLLHGALAAIHFPLDAEGEVDPALILAVRHHTLGSIGMGRLGALIYIADYIEPGRKHLGAEERERILSRPDPEGMVIEIMDMQRGYFESKGIEEAGVSKELYSFLMDGGRL